MQKFEQLIQQAFAKIDASNPKMRQKVYENIWLAQEKALAARRAGAAQKQAQREHLTQLLKNVEKRCHAPQASEPPQNEGVLPAEQGDFPYSEAAAPRREANLSPQGQSFAAEEPAFSGAENSRRREPEFSHSAAENSSKRDRGHYQAARQNGAPSAPPEISGAHDAPPFAAAEPAFIAEAAGRPIRAEQKQSGEKARRNAAAEEKLACLEQEVNRKTAKKAEKAAPSFIRRARLGTYIISALAVLVAIFVVWSFYNSFGGAAAHKQRAFSGPMQQNNYAGGGWAEIFTPANVTGLTVKGAAAADLHNEPDANFIRISAQSPDDAAVLDVGQGALEALRGKTATFKLVARSAENDIGQMNLTADFGGGLPLRRYSFELSPTAAPLLFRLDIPKQINGPAKFYLGTGSADGKPHQMDIFSLLLRESDDKGL